MCQTFLMFFKIKTLYYDYSEGHGLCRCIRHTVVVNLKAFLFNNKYAIILKKALLLKKIFLIFVLLFGSENTATRVKNLATTNKENILENTCLLH